MKKNGHITAFYLETLLLIVVFIGIILILTQVFGLGRVQSVEAGRLTEAVILAQNAAEAVSAADHPQAAAALLAQETGTWGTAVKGNGFSVCFDRSLRPDPEGIYTVLVSWDDEGSGLVRSQINVFYGAERNPVYTLETAAFHREVSP